ncbi:MAG: RsbRD N-terminal domain-containing protein [Candidatus Binataceae bacterium]
MGNFPDKDKDAIAQEWLRQTVATYPVQTVHFLLGEKDPFRNPMGHTLRKQLPAVTEELLGNMDREQLSQALESIVRIRAVQGFTASQSVSFLFLLKGILRERWKQGDQQRFVAEERIDEAVLIAFDLYMKCRERIYEVMADEARRRTAQLEKIYSAAGSR